MALYAPEGLFPRLEIKSNHANDFDSIEKLALLGLAELDPATAFT